MTRDEAAWGVAERLDIPEDTLDSPWQRKLWDALIADEIRIAELEQLIQKRLIAATNCICKLNETMASVGVHVDCVKCEAQAELSRSKGAKENGK